CARDYGSSYDWFAYW
nr:immunoglobulin heavy chain junction region [Mus musculus]